MKKQCEFNQAQCPNCKVWVRSKGLAAHMRFCSGRSSCWWMPSWTQCVPALMCCAPCLLIWFSFLVYLCVHMGKGLWIGVGAGIRSIGGDVLDGAFEVFEGFSDRMKRAGRPPPEYIDRQDQHHQRKNYTDWCPAEENC